MVQLQDRVRRLESTVAAHSRALKTPTQPFAALSADIADFRADIRRTVFIHTLITIGTLSPIIIASGLLRMYV